MSLLSQDSKEIDVKEDIFGFLEIVKSIDKLIKYKNNRDIIGLFGSYGEGKSTLIETFKKSYEEKYCFIYLDLWQYEKEELRYDFHKIYYNSKSRYYLSDNIVSSIFNYTKFSDLVKPLGEEFSTKRSVAHRHYRNFFKHNGIIKEIDRQKIRRCKDKQPIIIIENLDRLTTEDKVFALSTLHNHKDYIKLPMIIALDPNSIKEQKEYVENLINKVFTAFILMPNKTKTRLKKFITSELKSCGKNNLSESMSDILLTQYPITLRQIKHIINNSIIIGEFKTDEEQKISIFMAILQSNFPLLHSKISKNPFYIESFKNQAINIYKNIYNDLKISKEDAYKLNRLFREIGSIDIMQPQILKIVSPLFYFSEEDIFYYREENYLKILEEDNNKLKIVIEQLNEAHYEERIITILLNIIESKSEALNDNILELFLEAIQNKVTLKLIFLNSNYKIFSNFLLQNKFSDKNLMKLLNSILYFDYIEFEHDMIIDNIFNFIESLYMSKKIRHSKKCNEALVSLSLRNRRFFKKFISKENSVIESLFKKSFLNINVYIQIESLENRERLFYFTKLIEVYKPHLNAEQDKEMIESYVTAMFEPNFLKGFINDEELFKYYLNLFHNYDYLTVKQCYDFLNSNYYGLLNNGQKIDFFKTIINAFYSGKKLLNFEDKLAFSALIEKFITLLSQSEKDFLVLEDMLEALEQITAVDNFNLSRYDGLIKMIFVDIVEKYKFLDEAFLEKIINFYEEHLKKSKKFEKIIKGQA